MNSTSLLLPVIAHLQMGNGNGSNVVQLEWEYQGNGRD